MERNQGAVERLFSGMKKRTSGRPRLQEKAILYEEQAKQFSKYPDLFSVLKYENKEAETLLQSFSGMYDEPKSDEESESEDEDEVDADGKKVKKFDVTAKDDIVDILNAVLNERENCYYSSDSEDDDEDFFFGEDKDKDKTRY